MVARREFRVAGVTCPECSEVSENPMHVKRVSEWRGASGHVEYIMCLVCFESTHVSRWKVELEDEVGGKA